MPNSAAIGRYALRFSALGYLLVLLVAPVSLVFYRTFEHGFWPAWHAVSSSEGRGALWVTLQIALIVVPLNTVFGVLIAIAIVRHKFRGKGIVNALVDLPLALSPVIVGLALLLVYGRLGWFGPFLDEHGIAVVYAMPAMILATIFVSLPFVVREVVPILREIGTEQEQAAATLGASGFQIFRRITLPAIRWGVAYGVVLTMARAIGEYGAVSVVGSRAHPSSTMYVDALYTDFDYTGAYAISVVLSLIAILTLLVMTLLRPKQGED